MHEWNRQNAPVLRNVFLPHDGTTPLLPSLLVFVVDATHLSHLGSKVELNDVLRQSKGAVQHMPFLEVRRSRVEGKGIRSKKVCRTDAYPATRSAWSRPQAKPSSVPAHGQACLARWRTMWCSAACLLARSTEQDNRRKRPTLASTPFQCAYCMDHIQRFQNNWSFLSHSPVDHGASHAAHGNTARQPTWQRDGTFL